MFQAEPIIWLQTFASPSLTWVMSAITSLGYTPVYIALGIVMVFGFRLRPSLGVVLALLLSGILTESLKSGLALPRPSDVDARVVEPTDASHMPLVAQGAAPGFLKLPTAEAIAVVRAQPGASYGFPSGHVSSAAAFLFGIGLFFRSARRILIVAVLWPLLMGLSRMYLGRHFLADVLGGLAVGVLAAGAAILLLRGLDQRADAARTAMPLLPAAVVVLLLVLLTPWVPVMDPENGGRLTGFVAAYAVLLATGLPSDQGTVSQRSGRVVSAALVYLGLGRVINVVFAAAGWEDERLGTLTAAALITAGTLLGGVAIARRLRWYVAA